MTAIVFYMTLGLIDTLPEFLASSSKALEHRGPETVYTLINERSNTSMFIIIRDNMDLLLDQNDGFGILISAARSKQRVPDMLDENFLGAILLRADDDGIVVQRSLDGSKPIYYHVSKRSLLAATEKKALWAAQVSSISSLQPGYQLTFDGKQAKITQYIVPDEIRVRRDLAHNQFIEKLSDALVQSFNRLHAIDECGVLFSGGVDSSLAALLTKQICDEPHLISVFAEDSHDSRAARDSAKKLGIQLHEQILNEKIIWNCLEDVIYAIETTNRMDVEIAIPFFLAGRVASELGLKFVVSGQGPDELFAGYVKHVKIYEERGAEELEKQLMHDISITHEANLERDEKAIGYSGVHTVFPYLDYNFVRTALSIPAELKINPDETPNRKIIFRELATRLGLDSEIAMRPKRATQYSSGTKKLLMDAISNNIEEYRDYSRKRLDGVIQKVLDRMACA